MLLEILLRITVFHVFFRTMEIYSTTRRWNILFHQIGKTNKVILFDFVFSQPIPGYYD